MRQNIENICLEKHLYTLPGTTSQERMWVENLYNEVFEKNYNSVYEIIVDSKKEKLSVAERKLIISTIISMYYRTTYWRRTINEASDFMFECMFNMTKAYEKDSFTIGKQVVSIKDKTLEEFKAEQSLKDKPMVILSQLRQTINLIELRSVADCVMIDRL